MYKESKLKQNNERYAKACLIFAKRLGLVDDDSLDGVKSRCEKENEKRNAQKENGEIFYGLTHYTFREYLEWELTKIKLDFVSESETVKESYNFREISKKELKAFYKNNKDLFTRFNGDKFPFRDVKLIIKKKIREEEFENEINNILCKLD